MLMEDICSYTVKSTHNLCVCMCVLLFCVVFLFFAFSMRAKLEMLNKPLLRVYPFFCARTHTQDEAIKVMDQFGWGAEFLRVNLDVLDTYAACANGAEVVKAQVSVCQSWLVWGVVRCLSCSPSLPPGYPNMYSSTLNYVTPTRLLAVSTTRYILFFCFARVMSKN